MFVLRPNPATLLPTVALFGVGLIGSAISQHLVRSAGYRYSRFPFDWNQPKSQSNQMEQVMLEIGSRKQVVFVWAAGSGGFTLTSSAAAAEQTAFGVVLRAAERCAQGQSAKVPFHLLSSAGGLYEGQRLIGPNTPIRPLREYGRLKQAQETDLLDCSNLAARIYRPTSVYGLISSTGARGLIPTLVSNGLSQTVTTLFGGRQTLRDYVPVGDVGRFISQCIQDPTAAAISPMILASGRPVTLDEVISIVEQQLRRRLLVAVGPQTNAHNITFRGGTSPEGFSTADMTTGIRLVYNQWLQQGVWRQRFPHAG